MNQHNYNGIFIYHDRVVARSPKYWCSLGSLTFLNKMNVDGFWLGGMLLPPVNVIVVFQLVEHSVVSPSPSLGKDYMT